uniref:Calpain 13 n=1 Tax=Macaca fascicularis TaxID=9541 RepID=A0A7N9D0C9_MACFA
MAYNQESSVETSIIKFKDQDFTTLRDHCLSVGQTFKDETFPAADSSIGQKLLQEKRLSNVIWKRPQRGLTTCKRILDISFKIREILQDNIQISLTPQPQQMATTSTLQPGEPSWFF